MKNQTWRIVFCAMGIIGAGTALSTHVSARWETDGAYAVNNVGLFLCAGLCFVAAALVRSDPPPAN